MNISSAKNTHFVKAFIGVVGYYREREGKSERRVRGDDCDAGRMNIGLLRREREGTR